MCFVLEKLIWYERPDESVSRDVMQREKKREIGNEEMVLGKPCTYPSG
jgi:hypothetical protein